jgi:hypothetical protein
MHVEQSMVPSEGQVRMESCCVYTSLIAATPFAVLPLL